MIQFNVRVITKSSSNEVITLGPERLKVKVTDAPNKGQANRAVIKLLAQHFNVPKSRIIILSGETTTDKIIGLDTSV